MITAIILAAGKSTRMGSPKMLLPWGDMTVIEHVIAVFSKAGIEDILVVTGGARDEVETIVSDCSKKYSARSVYNENHVAGDMLSSIQCGLRNITDKNVSAALIGLGDQPQVQERSVRLLLETFLRSQSLLIVPSFQMRRGHPWLVARSLWNEVIQMESSQTPRRFLNIHAHDIEYVDVDNPSILADLDTPEEYQASRP
jgi:molybdenum cofactor cytidylyltransferase